MEKHHEFAPSSLGRLQGCPWSYHQCKGWTEPENKDAFDGRLLHEAIYDDSAFQKLGNSEKKTVLKIRTEHVEPYAHLEHYHELKLEIFKSDGTLFNFGTADFVVISPDGKAASLKDWKFGGFEVAKASENPQIKNYVVGIFQKFPAVEKVFAMTVQPVHGADDYDDQAEFQRSHLPELLTELESIVDRAKNANEAMANPNGENCRYCNKLQCEAFLRKMDENFIIMKVDSSILAEDQHQMTIEFADRLLCAEKEIKNVMEVKVQLAKDLVIANGGSENFSVRNGRVTKTVDWKALCEKHGICQEEIDIFTTEKQSAPFLAMKMKRKTLKND